MFTYGDGEKAVDFGKEADSLSLLQLLTISLSSPSHKIISETPWQSYVMTDLYCAVKCSIIH